MRTVSPYLLMAWRHGFEVVHDAVEGVFPTPNRADRHRSRDRAWRYSRGKMLACPSNGHVAPNGRIKGSFDLSTSVPVQGTHEGLGAVRIDIDTDESRHLLRPLDRTSFLLTS